MGFFNWKSTNDYNKTLNFSKFSELKILSAGLQGAPIETELVGFWWFSADGNLMFLNPKNA
jgi:hypothetical protein